jgi:hypothetical protein
MPAVNLPDGRRIHFPDGMAEAEITAALEQISGPEKGAVQSAQETLSDSGQGIAQGASFGFADEAYGVVGAPFRMLANAISGEDEGKGFGQRVTDAYARSRDFARGEYKQAQERSPVATTVGEVGGALAPASALQKGGVTLMNAAQPTVKSMALRGAGEGAAYGGAYGFGSGEGGLENRLGDAAYGATIGAVTGGVTGAASGALSQRAANKTIPSAEVLGRNADTAYKAVDQSGVTLLPKSFDQMVDDIAVAAKGAKMNEKLHPKSTGALEVLASSKGQAPTISEIDQFRQIIGDAAASPDAGDRRIAKIMIDKLDDFMDGLTPVDIAGSADPAKTVGLLNQARETYAMRKKADLVAKAFDAADLRAAASGSGGNIDNAVRGKLASLLQSKQARGFTPQEREMIEKVIRGGPVQNLMRWVGKLSPEGNGLMLALQTMAGVSSGGATIPLAVAGYGAKKIADSATPRNVEALSRLIRSGGNLPQTKPLPAQTRALMQALTVGSAEQGGIRNQDARAFADALSR